MKSTDSSRSIFKRHPVFPLIFTFLFLGLLTSLVIIVKQTSYRQTTTTQAAPAGKQTGSGGQCGTYEGFNNGPCCSGPLDNGRLCRFDDHHCVNNICVQKTTTTGGGLKTCSEGCPSGKDCKPSGFCISPGGCWTNADCGAGTVCNGVDGVGSCVPDGKGGGGGGGSDGVGSSCSTPQGSGSCIDFNTTGCSGQDVAGYCPGPANVRCCVANPTGGGGGGGTGGGGAPGGKAPTATPAPAGKAPTTAPAAPTPTTAAPAAPTTAAPTTTDTPTPSQSAGDVTLALKLKFQGITKQPANNSMDVMVSLDADNSETGTFTADSTGVWSGNVSFSGLDLSKKYSVFVKGQKHLQKRVCVASPTESSGGNYRCSTDGITLASGTNSLNFSNIILLAGDVDQDGVVDSVDIAYIRQNLGKTASGALAQVDLNNDGVVNTQDYSLAIAALSAKTDDPVN